MKFGATEEAFVLSSLKEFVKVWGSGCQAHFNLECSNGRAWVKLAFQLEHPADLHHLPYHAPQYHPQVRKPRHKGPARHQKDLARAAAHRARQTPAAAAAEEETIEPLKIANNEETDHSVATTDISQPSQQSIPPDEPSLPAATVGQPRHLAPAAHVEPPPPPLHPHPAVPDGSLPPPLPVAPTENVEEVNTITTPPSVRNTSLMFPPNPPQKMPPNTRYVQELSDWCATKPKPPGFHGFTGESRPTPPGFHGFTGEPRPTPPGFHGFRAEANTAQSEKDGADMETDKFLNISYNSPSQILVYTDPSSILSPNYPPPQLSPNLTPSQVARNLIPLFQPSPPSAHLLHLNHPAVLLLPDPIEGKLRKKVKKEINGLDKNDEKVKAIVHKAIIDFTNKHDFTYNHFEKRFDLPFGWH